MECRLDLVDRRILAALIEDAKISSKELSKRLNIHPNTLLQRVKKLEKEGIIEKYCAVIDFPRIEHSIEAIILLDVLTDGNWEEAMKPIAKLPEVVSLRIITGEHDVIILARVKNEAHLAQLLRKIHGTKVISKTSTHLIMEAYARSCNYNPYRFADVG